MLDLNALLRGQRDNFDEIETFSGSELLKEIFNKATSAEELFTLGLKIERGEVLLADNKDKNYLAACCYTLSGIEGNKLGFYNLHRLQTQEVQQLNPDTRLSRISFSNYLAIPNITLADRLELSYLIYTTHKNDMAYVRKFLMDSLNINSEAQIHKKMLDYFDKKALNPEYIPGIQPTISKIPVAEEAANKNIYLWRRLAASALAASRNNARTVNEPSRNADRMVNTRFLTPEQRDAHRLIIKDGKFLHRSSAKSAYENFSSDNYISHDKKAYAAVVINLSGEISVFNHHNMADRMAHSSMNSGRPVFFAGEIKISNGQLHSLTIHSGHYRPNDQNVYQVLKFFKEQGVDISQANIVFFDPLNSAFNSITLPGDVANSPTHLRHAYNANDFYTEKQNQEMDQKIQLQQYTIENDLTSFKSSIRNAELEDNFDEALKDIRDLDAQSSTAQNDLDEVKESIIKGVYIPYAQAMEMLLNQLRDELNKNGADNEALKRIDDIISPINTLPDYLNDEKSTPKSMFGMASKLLRFTLSEYNALENSLTPHGALKEGYPQLLENFLKSGNDPKEKNASGDAALHILAQSLSLSEGKTAEIIELLLKYGADLNQINDAGNSPLMCAVLNNNKAVIQLLLNKNVDINFVSDNGFAALHTAILEKNISMVNFLLQKGANPLQIDANGNSSILLAAKNNYPDILKALINFPHTAENQYKIQQHMQYNINSALYEDNLELLKTLLPHIANHNALLIEQMNNNRLGYLKVLLDNGAIINPNVEIKDNPIYLAANMGNDRMVDTLLSQPILIDSLFENDTLKPLAPSENHSSIVAKLEDHYRNTSLLIRAIEKQQPQDVIAILQSGANPNWQMRDGKSFLHYAALQGNEEIIKALIESGAKIDMKDVNGKAPLDYLVNGSLKNLLNIEKAPAANPPYQFEKRDNNANTGMYKNIKASTPPRTGIYKTLELNPQSIALKSSAINKDIKPENKPLNEDTSSPKPGRSR